MIRTHFHYCDWLLGSSVFFRSLDLCAVLSAILEILVSFDWMIYFLVRSVAAHRMKDPEILVSHFGAKEMLKSCYETILQLQIDIFAILSSRSMHHAKSDRILSMCPLS